MKMRRRDLPKFWLVPLLAIVGLGAAGNNVSSLVQAVKSQDQVAVKALLVQQHVDVNAPTVDGSTALYWAVYLNDSAMTNLLLEAGANVNTTNRYGAMPLWIASTNGNADMVETLLKAGANPNTLAIGGESPLMAASLAGSARAVKALITHGAAVNAKDAWRGQTPLMLAIGNHEPHPDVARELLEHGADVNVVSKGGLTALMFAVRQNDLESARLLLKAGANPNEKGPGGTTPLLMAINNSHYDFGLLLLDNGADVMASERRGFTPLHVAVQRRAGGRTENKKSMGETDERSLIVLKALLAHGADPNARLPLKKQPPNFNPNGYPEIMNADYGGATPLWIAANSADLEAMQVLVAAGADPLAQSIEHTTPLMVASGMGYGTRGPSANLGGRRLDVEEVVVAAVKQLVEWGNDVNAVNDNGQTALHGAAGAASPMVTQFLIDHGARLDQKDALGRTPFAVADDNRTDKYRTNQSLNPAQIEVTYALLQKIYGGKSN